MAGLFCCSELFGPAGAILFLICILGIFGSSGAG